MGINSIIASMPQLTTHTTAYSLHPVTYPFSNPTHLPKHSFLHPNQSFPLHLSTNLTYYTPTHPPIYPPIHNLPTNPQSTHQTTIYPPIHHLPTKPPHRHNTNPPSYPPKLVMTCLNSAAEMKPLPSLSNTRNASLSKEE